jgi:hypothetical protein
MAGTDAAGQFQKVRIQREDTVSNSSDHPSFMKTVFL